MKRFWHTWLMMLAVATMVSTASAQSGSRSAPAIGSYQSILSRAGYGDAAPSVGFTQPVQTIQSGGCASGGCSGVVTTPNFSQSAPSYGYQSAPVETYALSLIHI